MGFVFLSGLSIKIEQQENDFKALKEKMDLMENYKRQGSGGASRSELKETQKELNKLRNELKESGLISDLGNQAMMYESLNNKSDK